MQVCIKVKYKLCLLLYMTFLWYREGEGKKTIVQALIKETKAGNKMFTKYRQHTNPNCKNDQNEMKRYRRLNYFKQNCPIFRFAIQTFLRGE